MSFIVVYLIGLAAGFATFIIARKQRMPLRLGASILAFSVVSAGITLAMQTMGKW